jgi:hypothetical protein
VKRKIVAVAFVLLFAFGVFSGCRPSTPNDGIGRYQMHVTASGTVIIMDTVGGQVTNISKIEDYSIGGRTFGDAPSKALPRPPAH